MEVEAGLGRWEVAEVVVEGTCKVGGVVLGGREVGGVSLVGVWLEGVVPLVAGRMGVAGEADGVWLVIQLLERLMVEVSGSQ